MSTFENCQPETDASVENCQPKPVKCGCGGESKIYSWNEEDDGIQSIHYHAICMKCGIETNAYDTEAEAIQAWNKAMGADRGLDEWCTDCKEYDQEQHCCHRWNRVIKYVVDEVREKYDERTAKAKVNFKDENFFFGWCECGQYQSSQFPYCPACGCRLEWE